MKSVLGIILCAILLISCAWGDKKKALVILLSETRAAELTFDNIQENLLEPLEADLAVCIGVRDNYDYENPFYKRAKYRFLYPEPEDYAQAFDYAYETILREDPSISHPVYWREFLKIKAQFLGGIKDEKEPHPGSAGILIFFRWFLLHNLLKEGLLDQYDFFIITRSDYLYTLPHPSLDLFSEDYLYVPEGEQYGGVTDRHVVLPKKFVISYLNLLNCMIDGKHEYYAKMESRKDWNLESVIYFHLIQHQLGERIRFFPYVMYTVRPLQGSTRWSAGVFSEQHGFFIKYPTEYQLALQHQRSFETMKAGLDKEWLWKNSGQAPTLGDFYRQRMH